MTRRRADRRLVAALFATLLGAAAPAAAEATIRYRLDLVAAAARHEVLVEMTIDQAPSPLELAMPLWTPGACERREWGRNVTPGQATAAGRPLTLERTGPGTFHVVGHAAGAEVRLDYRVFADRLADDASQLDPHHAHLVGTSIFLRLRGGAARRHLVGLRIAAGHRVAVALDDADGLLSAPDYEALVDAPLEVGDFVELGLVAAGRPIRIVVDAGPRAAEETAPMLPAQLGRDLAAIVEAEARVVGPPPFPGWLAILHLADGPDRIAALEHRASTSIVMPRAGLRDPDLYAELLFVLAHELFHAWNARPLRPPELVTPDFDQPLPSRALWIVEGGADYYAQRALLAAGLLTRPAYLARIARAARLVRSDRTSELATLEEQALLAWQPADLAGGSSLYARGHLAMLGFDLAIRAGSGGQRSLDDVYRHLLAEAARRGAPLAVDTALLAGAAREVTGKDFAATLEALARRRGQPPLEPLLAAHGLALESIATAATPRLGLEVAPLRGLPFVIDVAPSGPAARAGLRAGDRLLALDGALPPASFAGEDPQLTSRQPFAQLEIERAGRRLRIPVAAERRGEIHCTLTALRHPTAAQRALREGWLGGPAPAR